MSAAAGWTNAAAVDAAVAAASAAHPAAPDNTPTRKSGVRRKDPPSKPKAGQNDANSAPGVPMTVEEGEKFFRQWTQAEQDFLDYLYSGSKAKTTPHKHRKKKCKTEHSTGENSVGNPVEQQPQEQLADGSQRVRAKTTLTNTLHYGLSAQKFLALARECQGGRSATAGRSGHGKTTFMRDLLVGESLHAATTYASRTLTEEQRQVLNKNFPYFWLSKGDWGTTLRTIIYKYAPKFRLTRRWLTESQLAELLYHQKRDEEDKNTVEGGTARPEQAESVEAFLTDARMRLSTVTANYQSELFEDSGNDLWAGLHGASETLRNAEEEATHDADLRDVWCATVFEGPWENLPEGHLFYDTPGLDPTRVASRTVVRIAQMLLKEVELIFWVVGTRDITADDLNLLEPVLSRPIREVPYLCMLFAHGKAEPKDHKWCEQVDAHGSLKGFYKADTDMCKMEERLDCMLEQALFYADVLPTVEGTHRLRVFRHLAEKPLGRTIVFYTREQWHLLAEKKLVPFPRSVPLGYRMPLPRSSADAKALSYPASEDSLRDRHAAVRMQMAFASQLKTEALLRDMVKCINTAVWDIRMFLSSRMRTGRIGVSPDRANEMREALEQEFAETWSWKAAVATVEPWLQPEEEPHWRHNVLQAVDRFIRSEYKSEQELSSALKEWLGLADKLPHRASRVKSLLAVVLDYRVAQAFSDAFVALRLLLDGSDPSSAVQLRRDRDAEIEELYQAACDQYYAEQQAERKTETDIGAFTVCSEELKVQRPMSGRGSMSEDQKKQVLHIALLTLYKQLRREADDCLERANECTWLADHVQSQLTTTWMAFHKKLPELIARGKEHDTVITQPAAKVHPLRTSAAALPASSQPPRSAIADFSDCIIDLVRTGFRNALDTIARSQPVTRTRQARKIGLVRGSSDVLMSDIRDRIVLGIDLRGHYQRVFDMVRVESEDAVETIRQRLNKLHKRLPEDPPSEAILTSRSNDIDFLEDDPILWEPDRRTMHKRKMARLPEPKGWRFDKGNFTLDAAKVQCLERLCDGKELIKTAMINREAFLHQAPFVNHPRRVYMDFLNGDPATHKMEIFAYNGLKDDVRQCVEAARQKDGGIAPIFICTSGKHTSQSQSAAAHLDLSQQDGLEMEWEEIQGGIRRKVPGPGARSVIFVVMEQPEAEAYFKAFCPPPGSGRNSPPNTVFVTVPGAHRGIRFLRHCAVYLAQSLRLELNSHCDLDIIHFLADDWHCPRVFDHKYWSTTEAWRPCTLFVSLRFQQQVLRYVTNARDGRWSLRNLEAVEEKFEGMGKLLKECTTLLLEKNRFGQIQVFTNAVTDPARVIARAQEGKAPEKAVEVMQPLMKDFESRFLVELQRMRTDLGNVVRVQQTMSDMTRLKDYNLMAAALGKTTDRVVGQQERLFPTGTDTSVGSVAAAHGSPVTTSSSSRSLTSLHSKRMTFRITYEMLKGCFCLFLPVLAARQVNYLSDKEFFLPQSQIDKRRENSAQWASFFDDRSFSEEVLANRGLGGYCVFKTDMAFRRKVSGAAGRAGNKSQASTQSRRSGDMGGAASRDPQPALAEWERAAIEEARADAEELEASRAQDLAFSSSDDDNEPSDPEAEAKNDGGSENEAGFRQMETD